MKKILQLGISELVEFHIFCANELYAEHCSQKQLSVKYLDTTPYYDPIPYSGNLLYYYGTINLGELISDNVFDDKHASILTHKVAVTLWKNGNIKRAFKYFKTLKGQEVDKASSIGVFLGEVAIYFALFLYDQSNKSKINDNRVAKFELRERFVGKTNQGPLIKLQKLLLDDLGFTNSANNRRLLAYLSALESELSSKSPASIALNKSFSLPKDRHIQRIASRYASNSKDSQKHLKKMCYYLHEALDGELKKYSTENAKKVKSLIETVYNYRDFVVESEIDVSNIW